MTLGLRAKSALALTFCVVIVLTLAVLAGWRALQAVEAKLGTAYARNATQYHKQRILAPIMRELTLSQRLADSEVVRRWLEDESNPAKSALFFAEAERYRHAFADHSYSVVSAITRHYYYNDDKSIIHGPRFVVKPGKPEDAWFFNTMSHTPEFNLNVERDVGVDRTKVWINVIVTDGRRRLGIAGTGLDLTRFLGRFIATAEPGVTLMVLNNTGAIQVHRDRNLIDYASINKKGASDKTIYRLMARAADQDVMRQALHDAAQQGEHIPVFKAELQGRPQLIAVSYIPELNWFVTTAVDLKAARVIDRGLWLPPLLVGTLLLTVLVLAIILAANRILLMPVLRLTASVRAMGAGNYTVELPPAGQDELGELTRAFGAMAEQVRSHTDELENRVRERTSELVAVNEQMAEANKKIHDSIQYASLIQHSILPRRELTSVLDGNYFVLWRPRDVVGGDFYIFRSTPGGFIAGVVDCAGHGVPGAFMTMVAHTAMNLALDTLGPRDPAAVLRQVDAGVRAMIQLDPAYSHVATHMDAGLAYVDLEAATITFAGAKISLYFSDGESVSEVKGDRGTLGGKKTPEFTNRTAPLNPHATYYLTTDGLIDQSGGPKGYGFGLGRLNELIQRNATRPCAEQERNFAAALAAYQGGLTQRDDVTLLGFRCVRNAVHDSTDAT